MQGRENREVSRLRWGCITWDHIQESGGSYVSTRATGLCTYILGCLVWIFIFFFFKCMYTVVCVLVVCVLVVHNYLMKEVLPQ